MPSSTAALIEGTIFELDDFDLDDGDMDFSLDDIHVAPRVHIKSKPRTQRNKAKTAPRSEPVCTRPLIFPHEILEFVCQHLPQATLRLCASLVSRQWHVVCNRFIRRVGVWKPLANDYQDALLAKLPNLNALECWAAYDPDVVAKENNILLSQHRNAWEYFFSRALQPLEHADLPPAPQCLLQHIRDFSIRFQHNALDAEGAICSILPGLRLLHTLNIQSESNIRLHLFRILESCPFLVNLAVRATASTTSYMFHGDAADDIPLPPSAPAPANGATAPVEPPKAPPKHVYLQRYRLTNFMLHGLIIKQTVLERLVTTCPDLRVFRVDEANKTMWKSGRYVTEPLNQSEMMNLILAKCFKIEWIHLAMCSTSDHQVMNLKSVHCPTHKSLALHSTDYLQNLPLLSLRAILHNITVLEIPRYSYVTFNSGALNNILRCTPNLQRLDARSVHTDASSLMWEPVRNVLKPSSKREAKRLAASDKRKQREARQVAAQQAAKAAAAEVALCPFGERSIPVHWNCRWLKSLKIRTMHYNAVNDDNFFRYLVQYCPLLEELHLWLTFFRIGQIVEFPNSKATRTSPRATKWRKDEPQRMANSIVLLTGLVRMRYLTLNINELKGFLQPSDFEFMRNGATSSQYTATWPDLESFRIRYSVIEIHQCIRSITAAVHDMRPAVEFRMKNDPSILLHAWH